MIIKDKFNVNYFYKKRDNIKNSPKYNLIKSTVNQSFSIYNLNFINMRMFLIITSIVYVLSYIVFYQIFGSIIPTLLMSLMSSIVPYNILIISIKNRNSKIKKVFPMYVLSLKNYTDIDNNIIYAMKESFTPDILQKYISKFNKACEKGVNVYLAFEDLKKDINIKEISQFINLLENCYLNGGKYSLVIEKYAKFETSQNVQKEKSSEDLFASKITLIILILLNVVMLFGFALNNVEYRAVILKTVGGQIVLTLNILTYIFIYYIYLKLCRMEE